MQIFEFNYFFISMSKRLIVILAIIGLLYGAKSEAYLTFSNGALIKGSGPEVYVLEHGMKRWIPNPEIFNNLSYDFRKILYVSDNFLNSYPKGPNITNDYTDGALLKTNNDPKVYLYNNNSLRWIPDPIVFNSNGFSWDNIVIVSNEAISPRRKGENVKMGEFINLPSTFIIAKPPVEINLTRVTFVYSGTNPTGPISELVWETFLDGYDAGWQWPSSYYTRVIDLPGENKTYTFYVRSRNKDGKIDDHPASYSFKTVGFSSVYSKIKFNGVQRSGVTGLDEYIRISNFSTTSANITGLAVRNKQNESFTIPKGYEYLNLGGGELKDIIIEAGKSAYIFSGPSPAGRSFRLNACTGYLNYLYYFTPKFTEECPKPIDQDISYLSKNCRDYITALPPCASPNTSDMRVTYDSDCTNYLINTFNYSHCVQTYQTYPDFLKNDWYIYANRSSGFLNDYHEELKLLDKDGNLIDSYSY